jgi:hypothetical protein
MCCFPYPPSRWAGLHLAAAGETDLPDADTPKKTMNYEHLTTTIAPCFFLILQVVGLASTLLKLVRLTCPLPDSLKKTMKINIQLQQLIPYPPGSWAGLLLLKLVRLTCLISDNLKKTMEN